MELPVSTIPLRYGKAGPDVLALIREKFRLTPTQARVATLLADRLTNAEIAHELRMKPSTARNHTEAVLFRLGVKSRLMVMPRLADIFAEALPS